MSRRYQVIKRYGHEEGLSCAFRQWKAPETHCAQIHGYALAFEITFEGRSLDHRNWLISFGELKEIKEFLKETFDHTFAVAADDPLLLYFKVLDTAKAANVKVFDKVGCEAFADYVFDFVALWIARQTNPRFDYINLVSVKIQEHGGNAVISFGDR